MNRLYIKILAVVTVLASVYLLHHSYSTYSAPYTEIKETTERIAAAIASGDRTALLQEPYFHNRNVTVDYLLREHQIFSNGYSVSVERNGSDGLTVMPGLVTHFGVIRSAKGTLRICYKYDQKSEQLNFVCAHREGY